MRNLPSGHRTREWLSWDSKAASARLRKEARPRAGWVSHLWLGILLVQGIEPLPSTSHPAMSRWSHGPGAGRQGEVRVILCTPHMKQHTSSTAQSMFQLVKLPSQNCLHSEVSSVQKVAVSLLNKVETFWLVLALRDYAGARPDVWWVPHHLQLQRGPMAGVCVEVSTWCCQEHHQVP